MSLTLSGYPPYFVDIAAFFAASESVHGTRVSAVFSIAERKFLCAADFEYSFAIFILSFEGLIREESEKLFKNFFVVHCITINVCF